MSIIPIDLSGVINDDTANFRRISEDYDNNNRYYNSDSDNFFRGYPLTNNEDNNIDSFFKSFNRNNDRTSIMQTNETQMVQIPYIFGNSNNSSSFSYRPSEISYDIRVLYPSFFDLDRTKINSNPTIQPFANLPREKKFFVKITPKKLGKRIKSETCKYNDPLVHNKYKEDLLIMKVKGYDSHNYLNHLNLMLKNSENSQINSIQLKNIDPSIIKVNSREDNLNLLKKEMSDIYSGNISKRFKNIDTFYNKKSIDLIKQKGDEEIINALKKTFKDSLDIYCSKRTDIYLFEKFQKIENDVEKFREDGEDEDYIKEYIRVAKNFEDIIKSKNKRQSRRKIKE